MRTVSLLALGILYSGIVFSDYVLQIWDKSEVFSSENLPDNTEVAPIAQKRYIALSDCVADMHWQVYLQTRLQTQDIVITCQKIQE